MQQQYSPLSNLDFNELIYIRDNSEVGSKIHGEVSSQMGAIQMSYEADRRREEESNNNN